MFEEKGKKEKGRKKDTYEYIHTAMLMLLYLITSFQFSFADVGNIKHH